MAHRTGTQHSCAERRTIKLILPSTKMQLILMWNTPAAKCTAVWGKPYSSSHCPIILIHQVIRISSLKMLFQHLCSRSLLRNRKKKTTPKKPQTLKSPSVI